jgi:UPF0716 protein FxsA
MRALAVLLCILAFPVLEAWVLFALAERFGWWVAVWLVAAAIVGLLLIRIERFAWSLRVAASLARNKSPFTALIASARTFVAGGLLIFPGVVSDALALLVLVWPLRRGRPTDGPPPEPGVIDGEYRRERPPELPRRE